MKAHIFFLVYLFTFLISFKTNANNGILISQSQAKSNYKQIICVDYITGKYLDRVSVTLHNKSYSYAITNKSNKNGITTFSNLLQFNFYVDAELDGYQDVQNAAILNAEDKYIIELIPNGIDKEDATRKPNLFGINRYNPKLNSNNIIGGTSENIDQSKILKIIVEDKATGMVIPYAAVKLHNSYGSYYKTASTDANGVLSFENLPSFPFLVDIYILGYKKVKDIPVTKGDVANVIKLESEAYSLNAVEIVGKADSMRINGDTSLYNASRYKSDIDENAESVLKKLPGTTVTDGEVSVEGDKVSKVTLNGKEYIKGNTKAALEQIPSDIIYQIEIIDQVSAEDPTQRTKTVNILTGDTEFVSFGKLVNAYGSNNRYRVAGNFYLQSEKQRFTFIADANNINKEDLLNGALSPLFEGDNTIKAAALKYFHKTNMRTEIDFSLNLNQVDRVQQQLFDQQLLFQTDEAIPLSSSINNKNITDKIGVYSLSVYQPLPKGFSATFISDGNLQSYRLLGNLNDAQTLNNQPVYTLESIRNNNNNKRGFNNRISAGYKSKINPEKNILKYSLKLSTDFRIRFEEDADSLNIIFNESASGYQVKASRLPFISSKTALNYKQFWKKNYILNYSISNVFSKNTNDINTLFFENDFVSDPILNGNLTGNNQISKNNFKAKANLSKKLNDFIFGVGVGFEALQVKSNFIYPTQEPFSEPYITPLSSVFAFYNINPSRSIKMWYMSQLLSPKFNDLNPVLNNNIPSQLTIGDIGTEPEKQRTLIVIYKSVKNKKTFTKLKLKSTFTNNYIGNQLIYSNRDTIINNYFINAGNRLRKPLNFDKRIEHSFRGSHEQNVGKWKYGVNYGLINQNIPTQFNDIEGKTTINRLTTSLYGNYYPSKSISVNLRTFGSYSTIKSVSTATANSNVINWNATSGLSYLLKRGLLLELETTTFQVLALDINSNKQLTSIVNLSAKQAIFKKRTASIQVHVFDLFNQNKDIAQSTEAFYYTQEQRTKLSRYILFVFALKF